MQIVRAWRHFGFDNDQRRAMDVVADFLLFFLDGPKRGQSESAIHYPIICAPARAGRRKRDNEKSIFKRRNSASNRGRIPASIRGRIPAPNSNLLIRPRTGAPDSGLKSRPDFGNIKRIRELSRPTFRRVSSGSLAVQSPNFWRLGAHSIRHQCACSLPLGSTSDLGVRSRSIETRSKKLIMSMNRISNSGQARMANHSTDQSARVTLGPERTPGNGQSVPKSMSIFRLRNSPEKRQDK